MPASRSADQRKYTIISVCHITITHKLTRFGDRKREREREKQQRKHRNGQWLKTLNEWRSFVFFAFDRCIVKLINMHLCKSRACGPRDRCVAESKRHCCPPYRLWIPSTFSFACVSVAHLFLFRVCRFIFYIWNCQGHHISIRLDYTNANNHFALSFWPMHLDFLAIVKINSVPRWEESPIFVCCFVFCFLSFFLSFHAIKIIVAKLNAFIR